MRTVLRPDRGVQDFAVAPISWEAFKAELLALYQIPIVAKGTRAKIKSVLKQIADLGVVLTDEFTVPFIARFCAARPAGQSDWTLRANLICLRTICSYAEANGYLRVSPFRVRKMGFWVSPPELEGKRHFSREEIRRLLDLLASDVETRAGWGQWRARRLQAAVAIVAYTGLRKTECLRLHVSDIDLSAGIIDLKPHGKRLKTTGSQKIVPMPDALIPIVTSWVAHRMDAPFGFPLPKECPWLIPTLSRKAPWVSGSMGSRPISRLQSVAKRAGIESMTFHALRRSLATHLEYFGAGEAAIGRILRHAPGSSVTKQFYRRADASNLRGIVQAVDF